MKNETKENLRLVPTPAEVMESRRVVAKIRSKTRYGSGVLGYEDQLA